MWYGPVATVASNNIVSYSVNIKVPARTGSLIAYPKGTYTASVRLYWDMDLLGLSCGDLLGGWDSGDTLLTANFVVPSLCQLNSTSTEISAILMILVRLSVITQLKEQ